MILRHFPFLCQFGSGSLIPGLVRGWRLSSCLLSILISPLLLKVLLWESNHPPYVETECPSAELEASPPLLLPAPHPYWAYLVFENTTSYSFVFLFIIWKFWNMMHLEHFPFFYSYSSIVSFLPVHPKSCYPSLQNVLLESLPSNLTACSNNLFSALGHIYCPLFFFPIPRDFDSGPQTYAYLLWFLWNVNTSDPFFLSWMSLLPGSFPHLAYDSCVLSAGSSFSYIHCSDMISLVPSVYSLSSGNIQSWSTDTLFLWAPAPPFPKVPLDIARSIWKSNSYILLAFSTETNTSLCPKTFSTSELEVSQDREEPDTPNLLITWVELLFLISILVQHKHLWKVTFSLRHLESSSFPICLLWGFKCSRLRYEVEERLGNTGPFLN